MNTNAAIYNAASVPSFCVGNPLSEALPPLPTDAGLVSALLKPPRGDFSLERAGCVSSVFEISSLLDINVPRPESPIVTTRIFSMIHNTYARMNPLSAEFVRTVNEIDKELIQRNEMREFQSDAMTILAWSGMGKTTLIRSIAELLPRVIEHTTYKGQPFFQKQVVWLSVDAPVGGSPKGFMLNIAQALDTALELSGPARYQVALEGLSAEAMKIHIARALRIHCVGLLHVDDVQRWGEADARLRQTSVAMLVGLSNTIGCSLLLSGTPEALKVLQSSFESSRRANRRSAVILESPLEADDLFLTALIDYLFSFQVCQPQVAPTKAMRKLLLTLTAGVPGVLTSLYVATQETALTLNIPLSTSLFREVMPSDFGILSTSVKDLRALRSKGRNSWDPEVDKQFSNFLSNRSKGKK